MSVSDQPTSTTPTTQIQFADLELIEPLLRAVNDSGYTVPTPIQQQAIPRLLEGRDLLGCAQTGTGKTAAFALPILQRLVKYHRRAEQRQARVLVLTPTRELAIQINDSFKAYGKYLKIRSTVIFGGVGQAPQVSAVAGGIDILVATPGRLLDLINQKHLSLKTLDVFVLDEADRMLDMGFIHDVRKIIAMLPERRHNLFFSATMPPEIKKLADSILTDPVQVEVTPVSSTAEMIEQSVMYVDRGHKKDLLRHVLQDKSLSRVIVFTRTKHGANKVSEILAKNNVVSEAIHGNKSQTARQRALENFRAGRTRVLVATDIAARGIDIDDISHVINFEVPNIAESYVHRIGRTARAGAQGMAISFCDAEERAFIKDIEKLIGKAIPVNRDQPFHSDEVENARPMSKGKAKAAIESADDRRRDNRRGQRGRRPSKGIASDGNRQQAAQRPARGTEAQSRGDAAAPHRSPKPGAGRPGSGHRRPSEGSARQQTHGGGRRHEGEPSQRRGEASAPRQSTQKVAPTESKGGLFGWFKKK